MTNEQATPAIANSLKGVNVYLVGLMGSGKTTIGKVLAKKLNYRFIDTDAMVELVAQRSIAELFATEGEAAFRQLETQVLAELSAYPRSAIATGGGIVLSRDNWSYLHHGLVVWLDVPIDSLYRRLQNDTKRPLLQHDNPKQRLQDLLDERRSLYAQADVRVLLQGDEPPSQVGDRVLEEIQKVLKPELNAASEHN
ncbi:shikimate kinase [Leptolyngbya sp. AN02str]|uniref:shikimate kinase n=1 Tax=Leptolyngbya sp. AN02str TaxID=3423363 RepID=UPI003D31BE4B